jgi:hypothetical protein
MEIAVAAAGRGRQPEAPQPCGHIFIILLNKSLLETKLAIETADANYTAIPPSLVVLCHVLPPTTLETSFPAYG